MGFSLGGFVGAITQPFVQAAQSVGAGVSSIGSGDIGKGLGQIGSGAVSAVKGTIYESGANAIGYTKSSFDSDPGGTVAAIGTLAASGGLISADTQDYVKAGSQILNSVNPPTPSQVLMGSGNVQATPTAATYESSDSSGTIILIGGGALLLFLILKRK